MDEGDVEFTVADEKNGVHNILIDGTIVGYVTMGQDYATIESADPENEWDVTVSYHDLGGNDLDAVKSWVVDHLDDFATLED